MNEIDNVKLRYQKRSNKSYLYSVLNDYNYYTRIEREYRYMQILKKRYPDCSALKLLEIGAGTGDNLSGFHRLGFRWSNLFANELLNERVELLKINIPSATILPGNALDLTYKNEFDIVFQSTVFTSILDNNFKQELANRMLKMLKPGGFILWYDFKFNNPQNHDVKGVGRAEIKKLFPDCKIKFYPVTLAPPIGRRAGRYCNLINNIFPFLRTHLVAEIYQN